MPIYIVLEIFNILIFDSIVACVQALRFVL